MTRRVVGILAVLLLGCAVAMPAETAQRAKSAAAQKAVPALSESVLKAQVMLARAGFSPGVIDARDGDNFKRAVRAFQQANGLPAGRLDDATMGRFGELSGDAALTEYVIQPQDTAGPFVEHIPQDYAKMAQLRHLSYRSPRQLLAAKFHMSEELLAALNKDKDLTQPGTVVTVANIGAPSSTAETQGSGSSAPPQTRPDGNGAGAEPGQPAAAQVVVDKRERSVRVLDPENRLIAFYPASIGSSEKPAPSGTLQVQTIAHNPDYTYNPGYAFKGQTATRPVTVRAGPNNPVGLVWIGLSLKGYGIHGTPEPEKVGKDQSHGCVRLTNWDALALSRLVKKGTPVQFVG
jgi:lipoprotein-anchoring transpeptidase ErfK/SrfK